MYYRVMVKPGSEVHLRHHDPFSPTTPYMLVFAVRGAKALCTWNEDHGLVHCTRWFLLRNLKTVS